MPDQHPASNTNAKKRLAEHIAELDAAAKSLASVTATEPPLSQPHSPEAHSDPTGALGGAQGVEAIRAMHSARGMDGEIGYVHDGLSYVQRLCFECDEGVPCRTALLLATLDEARAEVAWLTDVAETNRAAYEHATAPRLCSQCGEQVACMVKIGTSDGWCVTCLDEAAEPAARVEIERLTDVAETNGAAYEHALTRAEAAEAVVASVRELADDPKRHLVRWIDDSHLVDVMELRALLPTPTTTETEDES